MDRRRFVGSLVSWVAASGSSASELPDLTLAEASELVRLRKVSSVELTKACLDRIERWNGRLNAYAKVLYDDALFTAKERDAELMQGQWRGPLHGIPIGLKDLIDHKGVPTTAALSLFKNRMADQDAAIVKRLKDAGAVILGKQNLHQIALGTSAAISYFKAVHNPWNPARISGGSSGGSAAAVASRLDFGSVGTDTAGSIRIPSALCGAVGLKPTYGLVDATGVIPLSVSLDHVGPICRTVGDVALLLDGMMLDEIPRSSGRGEPPVAGRYLSALGRATSGLRLGKPGIAFALLDGEVRKSVNAAIDVLLKITAGTIRDVPIPYLEAGVDFLTVMRYEAYDFHKNYVGHDPHAYHKWIRRELYLGRAISQSAYNAKRADLEQMRSNVGSLFKEVDLLVLPTVAVKAMTIRRASCFNPDVALSRNTEPFNVLGLPAISIPCGFTSGGLPIGLQIVGPPYGDENVLCLAHAYEQRTSWHKRKPAISG